MIMSKPMKSLTATPLLSAEQRLIRILGGRTVYVRRNPITKECGCLVYVPVKAWQSQSHCRELCAALRIARRSDRPSALAMSQKVLTPDERRALFVAQGQTVTQWAAAHGYPRNKVYQVLGGHLRAKWGEAHRIAVDLGIKAATKQRAAT